MEAPGFIPGPTKMAGQEEEAAEQREKARSKEPATREEATVGMGELPEREEAK